MEHALPLHNPKTHDVNVLDVSKGATPLRGYAKPIKMFKAVDDEFFDDEDADLVNLDPNNPFDDIFDNVNKKREKYPAKYPKDDSFTDTNMDSTDTEPTDTEQVTESDSELSLYHTTTDDSDRTESINPNTEAHGYSSPSYHASEDDSDESTDTEYFDSDATTESSEKSYTSLSENVDESPDPKRSGEEPDPPFPPTDGGPPKTFKWSSDEEMEIPVIKTGGKTIDPFEDIKKQARDKFGPDYDTKPLPRWKGRDASKSNTSNASFVSSIVARIGKHLAPRNVIDYDSGLSEEFLEPQFTLGVLPYRDIHRFSNRISK